MIRVLHLITTLEAGGAQTMLSNLVSPRAGAVALRHVVVEMMSGGEGAECIRGKSVPVHSLCMERGRGSAGAIWRFLHLLRTERPSLVQTWLYHADLMGLAAVPMRLPVVWNIRSAWHHGISRLTPRLCARLSGVPAAVVVNSEAGRAVHESIGYRPRRWCLIGNGFELDVFKPDDDARASVRAEIGLAAGTPLVGLVGRWDAHKDHATFFSAAAALKAQREDVHFMLVGEGLTPDNPAVARMAANAGITHAVHLLGLRSDIPRLTAALDLATCTSIAEAFPNIVGEAMAAGVPCVATDVGDTAQLVGDRELIVPPRDPQALAAAWGRILALDAEARRKKGLEGRARIAERYSLRVIAGQYERLYQELVLK